ncbi:hypothetical protein [Azospirillum sp. sgz301742]
MKSKEAKPVRIEIEDLETVVGGADLRSGALSGGIAIRPLGETTISPLIPKLGEPRMEQTVMCGGSPKPPGGPKLPIARNLFRLR